MAWTYSVLVLANVTAASDELLDELKRRAKADSVRFTLVVPATGGGRGGRDAAERRLNEALERARTVGVAVDGTVGDSDPIIAFHEEWDPKRYDEIVVSTLPTGTSKWLQVDVPRRIERITGVPVKHVVAAERREPPHGEPPPEHERWGVLSPFQALGGGGAAEPEER